MATTPEEEFEGRTHVGDDARRIVESMRQSVAGGRDSSALLAVMLVIAAVTLTFAPVPYAQVGVGVLAWVAWRLGRMRT